MWMDFSLPSLVPRSLPVFNVAPNIIKREDGDEAMFANDNTSLICVPYHIAQYFLGLDANSLVS